MNSKLLKGKKQQQTLFKFLNPLIPSSLPSIEIVISSYKTLRRMSNKDVVMKVEIKKSISYKKNQENLNFQKDALSTFTSFFLKTLFCFFSFASHFNLHFYLSAKKFQNQPKKLDVATDAEFVFSFVDVDFIIWTLGHH